jgi:hypothetical protein
LRERFNALIEKLLRTKDLKAAQAIAIELQWAVYEYLDQLRNEALSDDPK